MTRLFSSKNFLLPGLGVIVLGLFVLSMGRDSISDIYLTAALCFGILAVSVHHIGGGDWISATSFSAALVTIAGVAFLYVWMTVDMLGLGGMFIGSYGSVAGAFIGLGMGMLATGLGLDIGTLTNRKTNPT